MSSWKATWFLQLQQLYKRGPNNSSIDQANWAPKTYRPKESSTPKQLKNKNKYPSRIHRDRSSKLERGMGNSTKKTLYLQWIQWWPRNLHKKISKTKRVSVQIQIQHKESQIGRRYQARRKRKKEKNNTGNEWSESDRIKRDKEQEHQL